MTAPSVPSDKTQSRITQPPAGSRPGALRDLPQQRGSGCFSWLSDSKYLQRTNRSILLRALPVTRQKLDASELGGLAAMGPGDHQACEPPPPMPAGRTSLINWHTPPRRARRSPGTSPRSACTRETRPFADLDQRKGAASPGEELPQPVSRGRETVCALPVPVVRPWSRGPGWLPQRW